MNQHDPHTKGKIKYLTIILFMFVFAFNLQAQTTNTDSIFQHARRLMLSQPEQARMEMEMALAIARSRNEYTTIVPILHQLGVLSIMEGDNAGTIARDWEALPYAVESGDTILLANCYTKLAKDYRKMGKPDSTYFYALEAIQLYKQQNREGFAWACHIMLGDAAKDAARMNEAEEHYLDAWRCVKMLNQRKEEFIVAGILKSFYRIHGQSEQYGTVINELFERNPFNPTSLDATNAHYMTLLQWSDHPNVLLSELRKSIALQHQYHFQYSLVASMSYLGQALTENGEIEAARDTLEEVLDLTSDLLPQRANVYYLLYDNRQAAHDLPGAIQYLKLHYNLIDSINTSIAESHIRELNVRYQSLEKDHALQQEKSISHTRTLQRNALLGIGVLLFILLGTGYYFLQNRYRLQRAIAEKETALQRQKINELEQEKKLLMMSSMIEGQEAERKRIARDLHDGLGGLLSSVKSQLHLIQNEITRLESMELYQKANHLIDSASTELRRIAYNMMPSSLSKLGLQAALEDLASSMKTEHGLDVSLEMLGLAERLPETTEIMLYRITQELCNNILKHARATRVLLQVNRTPNELFLVVEDDGAGATGQQLEDGKGLGMKSIASRVRFLDGLMDINTSPGQGLSVSIHIPLSTV